MVWVPFALKVKQRPENRPLRKSHRIARTGPQPVPLGDGPQGSVKSGNLNLHVPEESCVLKPRIRPMLWRV